MKKVALFPGSFDPFTLGHKSIVESALEIFDELTIAIGCNISKKGYYSVEKRIELIEKTFPDNPRIKIVSYQGLTVEYCRANGIRHIIRGLRNINDFEFEREIALVNQTIYSDIETIFLLTPVNKSIISSNIIRELLENGANPMKFLPKELSLEDLIK